MPSTREGNELELESKDGWSRWKLRKKGRRPTKWTKTGKISYYGTIKEYSVWPRLCDLTAEIFQQTNEYHIPLR